MLSLLFSYVILVKGTCLARVESKECKLTTGTWNYKLHTFGLKVILNNGVAMMKFKCGQ
jgi:hypothetical protein